MRIDMQPTIGRSDRLAIARPATLRDPARAPIDVLIHDLSATGALLETDKRLPIGTLVTLGVAGVGIQLARIVRITADGLACEFTPSIEPARLAHATTADTIVSVAFPQIAVPSQAAAVAVAPRADPLRPDPRAMPIRAELAPPGAADDAEARPIPPYLLAIVIGVGLLLWMLVS